MSFGILGFEQKISDNVFHVYKTKYQTVQAVKDVSCDLSAGTLYALVGKSGSGKTTLLSLLAGLDTPQSGDIMVNGQSLREIDVDIYRRKQASVIYQSYNLFPLMTVCENVMYPLKLLRHSDADAKKEAQIALEKVGLGESYWKRLPAMLSGGEQQRVAIARTLAVHAQIVLADEPTGNLDTENSSQIIQLLSKLAHEETCCVVVVTHDLEVAKAADVVFRIRIYEDNVAGRITDEKFSMMSKTYEDEQAQLKAEIQTLQQEIEVQERQIENLEQFIQRVRKYEDLDELTPYALRELVKAIYIEAPDKSSGKRHQGIRISYDLVGFIPVEELLKQETA